MSEQKESKRAARRKLATRIIAIIVLIGIALTGAVSSLIALLAR